MDTTLEKHEDLSFSGFFFSFSYSLFLSLSTFSTNIYFWEEKRTYASRLDEANVSMVTILNWVKKQITRRDVDVVVCKKLLRKKIENGRESIDWLTIVSFKNDENKQLRIENNDSNGYRSKETQTKQLSGRQITDVG
jgi:hypothetical protein